MSDQRRQNVGHLGISSRVTLAGTSLSSATQYANTLSVGDQLKSRTPGIFTLFFSSKPNDWKLKLTIKPPSHSYWYIQFRLTIWLHITYQGKPIHIIPTTQEFRTKWVSCETSGSHSNVYEDSSLIRFDAMSTDKQLPVFWSSLLFPFSKSKEAARGTQRHSWLRHCVTNWKVAGSIPNGVTGILQWLNPCGCIVALGSTQPLTEMSTRNPSWGLRWPVRRADNLTTFMCPLSRNSGASTSRNTKGLPRPVAGKLYLFFFWGGGGLKKEAEMEAMSSSKMLPITMTSHRLRPGS
jgi:hypothetical protein